MFCGNLCASERFWVENRTSFPLDFDGGKRYHRSQLHKNTALKKRSICGGFSENRRLVRADNRKQRRALWSSIFTKRADEIISQRGWNRGRFLELSSLANRQVMEAFFMRKATSHADDDVVLAHKAASIRRVHRHE